MVARTRDGGGVPANGAFTLQLSGLLKDPLFVAT